MRCEHCDKKLGKGNWVNHQCPSLPKPPRWPGEGPVMVNIAPTPGLAEDTQPARPRLRSRRSRKAPGE